MLHVGTGSETASSTTTDDRDTTCTLFNMVGGPATEPLVTTVSVIGANLMIEVDIGASASVVSETTYHNALQSYSSKLQPLTMKLRTYT